MPKPIESPNQSTSPVRLTALLALAYSVSGAAGLLLGAPSPVFPSAGLALSSVLWFGHRAIAGVWLGAFTLNFALNWVGDHWLGASLNTSLLLTTAVISLGATLQAVVGARLVRVRLKADWWEIAHERDVVRFLVYGGVLAGLVSASFGTCALLASGQLALQACLFTWWTWYVGDVIGILVFAPLTLLVLNRNNELWRDRREHILFPMLVTLCLAIFVFHGARRWETEKDIERLKQTGETIARDIGNRLNTHREALSSLQHFIEATPNCSVSQFERFTRSTLADNPDISSLSFNEWVTESERADYEARMSRMNGGRPFQIKELDTNQHLTRAPSRPFYIPVSLIVPHAGNESALGFDINSEPLRRAAVDEAIRTRQIAVTPPIKLVQEASDRFSVLELLPVDTFSAATSGTPRRIKGLVVAVIRIDDMIAVATQTKAPAGLVLNLADPHQDSRSPSHWIYARNNDTSAFTPATAWQTPVRIGNQDWVLSVAATDDYLVQHRSWVAWVVGVFGLLFAALLQIYILGMTGGAAIIRRKNSELESAELVLRDLNANLELKVEERTAQLAAASAAKSQFLAHMSHEIRTPMNGVLGMAQVLRSEPLSRDQREIVDHILAAGQLLLSIINDILDFSRIEMGQLKLELRPFDLAKVLAHIGSLMRNTAQSKGLSFSIESPINYRQPLLGDPLRLEQVLVNLVGNAIKFTAEGRVTVRATPITQSPTMTRLRFEVEDTGIGIPAESLTEIFSPFAQADSTITRRFGGTGLGLAISKQLAELMGGQLGAESAEGMGSTFWFELAFQHADRVDEISSGESRSAPAGLRLAGKRILVVDDAELNRKVVERGLKREGASITTACDGLAALELLTNKAAPRPDAVLMDLQMPVLDGAAATKRIRRELSLPHLPVIALTAGVLPEQEREARAAGCNDFVRKPVDLEELVAVLSRWIAATRSAAPVTPSAELRAFPSIPGLDVQQAASLLDNDLDLFLELLNDFASEFGGAVDATRTDISRNDRDHAARRLHSLRGAAGYLGAMGLVESAQALETAILESQTELGPLLADFEETLNPILEASRQWRRGSAGAVDPPTSS